MVSRSSSFMERLLAGVCTAFFGGLLAGLGFVAIALPHGEEIGVEIAAVHQHFTKALYGLKPAGTRGLVERRGSHLGDYGGFVHGEQLFLHVGSFRASFLARKVSILHQKKKSNLDLPVCVERVLWVASRGSLWLLRRSDLPDDAPGEEERDFAEEGLGAEVDAKRVLILDRAAPEAAGNEDDANGFHVGSFPAGRRDNRTPFLPGLAAISAP